MQFGDVYGHDDIKAALKDQYIKGKLPHAMLFAGPAGNGKLPVAIALAQYIHCINRNDNDSCGVCSSCVKIRNLAHPDLHFSFPTINTKGSGKPTNISSAWMEQWRTALQEIPYMHYTDWMSRIADENKQGNISRNEVHQIIQKLSLRTYESASKIMIIWMAEYLQEEGNLLLKLIEEPPEGTYLILIADRPDDVLGTILSRCQLIRFGMMEDEGIARGIQQDFNLSEQEARNLAPLAEGDYMTARKLAAHENSDIINDFIGWMRLCYKVEAAPLVDWVEEMSKRGREAQKQFVQGSQFLLREALHFQYNPAHKSRLEENEVESLKKFSQYLQFDQLVRLQEQLEEDYRYIARNGNPKVIFMTSSLSAHKILKDR